MLELHTAAGAYRCHSEIQSGGQGTVWAATDPAGRAVAVKVSHAIPQLMRMCAKEIEEMRALAAAMDDSPRWLVAVLDAGRGPHGEPFFVMPMYPKTLGEVLTGDTPLPTRLEALAQACFAVELFHACARPGSVVVHRDIKPSNFLVQTGAGGLEVRLADFGGVQNASLADAHTRTMFHTPSYAPPEQYLPVRTEASQALDVFALGVLVFEGITTDLLPAVGRQAPHWHAGDALRLMHLHQRRQRLSDDEQSELEGLRRQDVRGLLRLDLGGPLAPDEVAALRRRIAQDAARWVEADRLPSFVDGATEQLVGVLTSSLSVDPWKRNTASALRTACLAVHEALVAAADGTIMPVAVSSWSPAADSPAPASTHNDAAAGLFVAPTRVGFLDDPEPAHTAVPPSQTAPESASVPRSEPPAVPSSSGATWQSLAVLAGVLALIAAASFARTRTASSPPRGAVAIDVVAAAEPACVEDAISCGATFGGEAAVLYRCTAGEQVVAMACVAGCEHTGPDTADHCAPEPVAEPTVVARAAERPARRQAVAAKPPAPPGPALSLRLGAPTSPMPEQGITRPSVVTSERVRVQVFLHRPEQGETFMIWPASADGGLVDGTKTLFSGGMSVHALPSAGSEELIAVATPVDAAPGSTVAWHPSAKFGACKAPGAFSTGWFPQGAVVRRVPIRVERCLEGCDPYLVAQRRRLEHAPDCG